MTDKELARKVATVVMGWTYNRRTDEYFTADKKPALPYHRDSGQEQRMAFWNPLQDANHTEMVIDRMIELGWSMKVGDNVPPPIWYCEFWKYTSERLLEGRAFDNNRLKAICLAALAAVEAGRY